MNFFSIGTRTMSSDETAKIEPKIEPTLIVKDAPSIVSETPATTEAKVDSETAKNEIKSESAPTEVKTEAPKLEVVATEAPKAETATVAAAAEAPKVETLETKAEPPKLEAATEAKSETITLSPEPQIEP